ncbi:hypothetical protein [Streptomyces halstedii]|uniref:hypothetical protein n=1 Tax=Streptomyces halstedii TaxID=1944 RepID=UPI0006896E4B
MTTNALPMPVAEALANGAPRNLGALATTATRRGWGAMVERDQERDAWTLILATPSDRRALRYTWRAGKWSASNAHGYRETLAFHRSEAAGTPDAEAAPVKVPAGDTEAATVAEAEAGVMAAGAALDAVKAGRKAEDALAEARKHKDAAEGFRHSAEVAQEAAEAARTWAEAEAEADQAEADAKGAAEAVAECKRAFQRAQRAVTECRKSAEAATGALYETEADRAYELAKDARETARETLGTAEEAAEAAKEAAETARATADDECMKCGEWLCACREIMCAMLARCGSGVARTVDAEAVRIGELIMSDDEEFRAAGQMMLGGDWAEAEETLARAEEGPAEAEARRAAVRTAEAEAEAAAAERPAPDAEPTCEGRTARQWADVADAHAQRAAEAYELTETAVRYRSNIYDARPVDRLDEAEGKRVREAFARIDRRSRTAYDCELSARRDWWDGAEITDPARARDCAERARVLADACEADARMVAEAFAWAEAEAAAAAELQRAEWSLADAEERYEAARRPNAWIGAQGVDRRIGETNALRLVWIARQALAAVNGAPFVAYPTLTDRGTVKGWNVGHCTVSRYAGTAVRIVDTSTDQYRAEAIAEDKNREHAARVLCERMAGELVIMRALMDDARHENTKVPGGRYRQARAALEAAEELHDRAARERGTGAADRIAPVADKVSALGATVAEYARDRAVWAQRQEAAEAARVESAPVPAETAVEEAPRYQFGRRDAEGRYPVSVDGAPVGHVYRTRRTWWARGLDERQATDHTSRAAAAVRLVGLVDVRAAAEADRTRRMRARTVAPVGWRFTTWDAVESGDVVRTPRRCVPVSADGGPLSPETWGAPVTLTGVERLENGSVVARGQEGDAPGWLGMGVLLSTPRYAEVGLLVPDVERPAEAAAEGCPAAAERPAAAEAAVGRPLSRRAQAGGSRGVRAGHSTRQGAARQATRQGARQASGENGRRRERGPPPPPALGGGCRRFPET